jgi:ubiquinone/menaquinone biosynthesis C-methylase UbiE
LDQIRRHNQRAWDKQVRLKNKWTIPVSRKKIENARHGNLKVLLTPWKPVPGDWFPEIKDCNVLCLASAGGQQGPLFAAAGAKVIVLDLSIQQLKQDQKVGTRENLNFLTVLGNMSDLSMFADNYFDLIFNPVSNCFIPDLQAVWNENFRVLKPGGYLMTGFVNPLVYLFEDDFPETEMKLEVKYKIPYSDARSLTRQQKKEYTYAGYPLEFSHTLETQINGQLKAGFILTDFYEDRFHRKDHPLYKHIAAFIATKAVKPD